MTDIAYLMNGTNGQNVSGNALAATHLTSTPAGFAATATSNGGSGTITLDNTSPFVKEGSTALKFVAPTGLGQLIRFPFAAGARQVAVCFYHGAAALPLNSLVICAITNGSDAGMRFFLATNGSITVQTTGGVSLGSTAAGAWAAGRRNRIEVLLDNSGGTTAGTCTLRVFNDDGTTPTGTVTVTGANFTAADFNRVDLGTPSGTSNTFTHYYDVLQLGNGRTTELGPYNPVNVAPTATITSSTPSTVMQNDTVPLRGTATDTDGTISTVVWQIISYPAALSDAPTITDQGTLTSAAFVAVAAGDYTVRLSVTDNAGAVATTEKTITAVPLASQASNELVWTGGSWE